MPNSPTPQPEASPGDGLERRDHISRADFLRLLWTAAGLGVVTAPLAVSRAEAQARNSSNSPVQAKLPDPALAIFAGLRAIDGMQDDRTLAPLKIMTVAAALGSNAGQEILATGTRPLDSTFFSSLLPGEWSIDRGGAGMPSEIRHFDRAGLLLRLNALLRSDPTDQARAAKQALTDVYRDLSREIHREAMQMEVKARKELDDLLTRGAGVVSVLSSEAAIVKQLPDEARRKVQQMRTEAATLRTDLERRVVLTSDQLEKRIDQLTGSCAKPIIDELNGVNAAVGGLSGDIRKISGVLENREETTRALIDFGSQVLRDTLGKSSLGREVVRVERTFTVVMEGYRTVKQAINTFNAFKDGAGLALGLASSASILGAVGGVAQIAGMFGGGSTSKQFDQIIGSLDDLKKDLKEFRKDVEQRFDTLEDLARENLKLLNQAIDLLGSIRGTQEELAKKLNALNVKVDKLWDVLTARYLRDKGDKLFALEEALIDSLFLKDPRELERAYIELRRAALIYALRDSRDPDMCGALVNSADGSLRGSLALSDALVPGRALQFCIGAFPQALSAIGLSSGVTGTIPNPVEWVRGAHSLLCASVLYPASMHVPNTKQNLVRLIEDGKKVQEQLRELVSKTTLERASKNFTGAHLGPNYNRNVPELARALASTYLDISQLRYMSDEPTLRAYSKPSDKPFSRFTVYYDGRVVLGSKGFVIDDAYRADTAFISAITYSGSTSGFYPTYNDTNRHGAKDSGGNLDPGHSNYDPLNAFAKLITRYNRRDDKPYVGTSTSPANIAERVRSGLRVEFGKFQGAILMTGDSDGGEFVTIDREGSNNDMPKRVGLFYWPQGDAPIVAKRAAPGGGLEDFPYKDEKGNDKKLEIRNSADIFRIAHQVEREYVSDQLRKFGELLRTMDAPSWSTRADLNTTLADHGKKLIGALEANRDASLAFGLLSSAARWRALDTADISTIARSQPDSAHSPTLIVPLVKPGDLAGIVDLLSAKLAPEGDGTGIKTGSVIEILRQAVQEGISKHADSSTGLLDDIPPDRSIEVLDEMMRRIRAFVDATES